MLAGNVHAMHSSRYLLIFELLISFQIYNYFFYEAIAAAIVYALLLATVAYFNFGKNSWMYKKLSFS